MTKAQRKATAVLVATLVMMVTGRASAHDEPIASTDQREVTIVLHVANYAALSRGVLDLAKARVASIYKVIGVRIVWVDSEETVTQDGELHLTILLLSRDMAEKKISTGGITSDALGQAHLPSGRAYIFCDRIKSRPDGPTFFSLPLGHVIAHEVGHLVLRSTRHSRSGLMRAGMDVRAIQLRNFEKSEAHTIRTLLVALRAEASDR